MLLNRLKHNYSVLESSRLISLNPILSDGIIRVGGRLDASNNLSYEEMHPIVLPSVKVCYISKLIIFHFHEICKHQGRVITVNTIRIHGYWIMSLISSVAAAIHNCTSGRILYKNTMEQQMSNLPSDRVNEALPFSYSAVDIFRQYLVKLGRKTLKWYAVLFTCLVCRAVHIEVANSLTTYLFINAYRKFVSIRRKVRLLRSEYGPNFVVAERELRFELDAIDNDKVKGYLMKEACDISSMCLQAVMLVVPRRGKLDQCVE